MENSSLYTNTGMNSWNNEYIHINKCTNIYTYNTGVGGAPDNHLKVIVKIAGVDMKMDK